MSKKQSHEQLLVEIENMRRQLNDACVQNQFSFKKREIVHLSRQLDEIINQYYKEISHEPWGYQE